jgi:hypothetical protein
MGNNNRWAREGGVIDELLVENMWRNPEGNPVIFDTILLEAVSENSRIKLLLNTAVHEIEMRDENTIAKARAFCSQNQILYSLEAPLFVDASGDGVLGFLAGAEFRMGNEAASEFNEQLAPSERTNQLLGHSIYFYSRDTGQPVRYVAPSFALRDIAQIPRFRELRVSDSGCRLWWLEYGGNLDTVFQTEEIKWELWKVAYGVWNYIKNSGNFPDAENLTLEWMGTIPGKRESRRFIGDIVLSQTDIVEQHTHEDAVSFGGWAIDLHPSDGVYSSAPGCAQWHSKGVYQIPFRAMYSRNIDNLFLAGRLISASHIAFGSTRVMATCAHNAQAVGVAAALCKELGISPRELLRRDRMQSMKQRLLGTGQHIPGIAACDKEDLARQARITASSTLRLGEMPPSGELSLSDQPYALLLPMSSGPMPAVTFVMDAERATTVRAELWGSSLPGNTTPDLHLATVEDEVPRGLAIPVELHFDVVLHDQCHLFVILPPVLGAVYHLSQEQLPGVLTLSQKMNPAVAKTAVQSPPEGSGVDKFAFWLPDRRPIARNLAASISPPIEVYAPSMVINGYARPWCGANAWAPDKSDQSPRLYLAWEIPQTLRAVQITFDTDFDHPMESVLMTHPERVMPGCVTAFRLSTEEGRVLAEVAEHHQTIWRLDLKTAIVTQGLTLEILGRGTAPPAIFEIRCY